jgi:hypothetical protein
MMNQHSEAPFVADIDPAFLALGDFMRVQIRTAEAEFRVRMRELVGRLPPEIAVQFQNLIIDCPAGFIKGLLPFFAIISELVAAAEQLQAELAVQRNLDVN